MQHSKCIVLQEDGNNIGSDNSNISHCGSDLQRSPMHRNAGVDDEEGGN